MYKEQKFEVEDVDNYSIEEEQIFSHQALVMKAIKRCLELGSLELHEGADVREFINGKVVIIHKPNEREQFINSIKILKSLMTCDFDKDAKTNLISHKTNFNNKRKELLQDQFKLFQVMPVQTKMDLEIKLIHKDFLDKRLPQFKFNKANEIEYYRNIFEELNLLTERLDFYKSLDAEA